MAVAILAVAVSDDVEAQTGTGKTRLLFEFHDCSMKVKGQATKGLAGEPVMIVVAVGDQGHGNCCCEQHQAKYQALDRVGTGHRDQAGAVDCGRNQHDRGHLPQAVHRGLAAQGPSWPGTRLQYQPGGGTWQLLGGG